MIKLFTGSIVAMLVGAGFAFSIPPVKPHVPLDVETCLDTGGRVALLKEIDSDGEEAESMVCVSARNNFRYLPNDTE